MIRSVRLTDLIEIRRAPYARMMLLNEHMLAGAHHPLWFALRCSLQLRPDHQTLVYRERGLRGYLQARCRPGSAEADLLYLAAQPLRRGIHQPTDPDVWHHLLHDYIEYAGNAGIERIFAPLPAGSPHSELFRQLGFQAYAQRQIWRVLTPDVAEGSSMIALRPLQRRDPHAVQRLYQAVTPAAVQRAEMRSARSWQAHPMRNGVKQRTWLLGHDSRDDVLRAALHVWQGRHAAIFTLLIDPLARDLTSDVVRFGLTQVATAHQGMVYVLLPEYHSDLGLHLQALGFEHLGDQRLVVKSTTALIRKPMLRPILEPTLESAVVRPSVSSSTLRDATQARCSARASSEA